MHKRAEYPRKVNRRKENARTFRCGRLTNRQLLFLPGRNNWNEGNSYIICIGGINIYYIGDIVRVYPYLYGCFPICTQETFVFGDRRDLGILNSKDCRIALFC